MDALAELRSWWKVPCIAHFCSLFRGVLFDQSDLDIEDLEEALIKAISPGDSPVILDLLCSLLEGIYGREKLTVVDYDRYLKDIFRYQHAVGNIKTNPIENSTYFELSLKEKVDALHNLCDFRLESEDVMEVLKGHDGDNMRVEPLGHDKNGATYWYFYGTRLYQEDAPPKEPEEEKSPKHGKQSKKGKKKKKSEREVRAERRRSKTKQHHKKKEEVNQAKPVEEVDENKQLIRPMPRRKSKRKAIENITGASQQDEDEGFIEEEMEQDDPIENESMDTLDVTEKSQDILSDSIIETKMEEDVVAKEDVVTKEAVVAKVDIVVKEDVVARVDVVTEEGLVAKVDVVAKETVEEIVDITSAVSDAMSKIKNIIYKEELDETKPAVSDVLSAIKEDIVKNESVDIKTSVSDILSAIKNEIVKEELDDIKTSVTDVLSTIKNEIIKKEINVVDVVEAEIKPGQVKAEVKNEEPLITSRSNINDIKDLKEDVEVIIQNNAELTKDKSLKSQVAMENKDAMKKKKEVQSEDTEKEDLNTTESSDKKTLETYDETLDSEVAEVMGYVMDKVEGQVADKSESLLDEVNENNETSVNEEKEREEASRWHMVCNTLEDWQNLSEFFRESEVKCENALYRTIVEDFLPEIPNIIAEREKELAKRLLQNEPRRQSSRLEVKRIEQEEQEKLQAVQDAEELRQKQFDEENRMEKVRRSRIEDQKKAREERERVREERAERIKKREERARLLAEGIEVPVELRDLESPPPEPEVRVKNLSVDNEVTVTMYKVLDSIKNHVDSWLFWEPVEESFAPGYFDVVKHPLDLMKIEAKVNNRSYKKTDEFFDDLHLMFDNCILYNGTDSDYAYMATKLRNHLKKVYKRLMPKEEDPDYDPIVDTFQPIEPEPKPVKKKRQVVYQAQYEQAVFDDMLKCPPKKSTGTFKHGNYMVHMMPARRVSHESIFKKLDEESKAYKKDKKVYTKLPPLAVYPRPENEPEMDPEDPLANRFKRKVDPSNVLGNATPTPSTPSSTPKGPAETTKVGTPKVETITSSANPAVKKNVWHISQEDMVKYRKIAAENNGLVEIKGPDGKVLKLQFKSVPKIPESSTPPAASTPSKANTPASENNNPSNNISTPDTPSGTPVLKTDKPVSNETESDPSAEIKNLEKAASAAVDAVEKRSPKPTGRKPRTTKQSAKIQENIIEKEASIDSVSGDQDQSDSNASKTSDKSVDENHTEIDLTNETSSTSSQAEVDYESFKKTVETANGNKKKAKYDPSKKKSPKSKSPNSKQSLDKLEKKLREGPVLVDGSKAKVKKETKQSNSKTNDINGVIIRGVHHTNGIANKKSKTQKQTDENISSLKGNDSEFDDEDDIPLKKLWHPVEQSPDKMKLKICRGRKDSDTDMTQDDAAAAAAVDSPRRGSGILKKIGTFDGSPFTKIKHKLPAEDIDSNKNSEPVKKKKRVSFSETLSFRNLPPVGEPGMAEKQNFTEALSDADSVSKSPSEPIKNSVNEPVKQSISSFPQFSAAQHSRNTASSSTSSYSDESNSKTVLTTMQQKMKKIKSENASEKYVCDFDIDDEDVFPPSNKSLAQPTLAYYPGPIPTRGPCSYLKTSSCSALREKPHEFSVNAPKSTTKIEDSSKLETPTHAHTINKPSTQDPSKPRTKIISVINKTAKTVSSVIVPIQETSSSEPANPAVLISEKTVVSSDVQTDIGEQEHQDIISIDTSNEDEQENMEEEMPPIEIDAEEQKRAEALIKDLVKEITQSGVIHKKDYRKGKKDRKIKEMSELKKKNKEKSSHNSEKLSKSKEKDKHKLNAKNSSSDAVVKKKSEISPDLSVTGDDENHKKSSITDDCDLVEGMDCVEASPELPPLDKELPVIDSDMPTLEPISDSALTQSSSEYEELSDEDDDMMPTLEESPGFKPSYKPNEITGTGVSLDTLPKTKSEKSETPNDKSEQLSSNKKHQNEKSLSSKSESPNEKSPNSKTGNLKESSSSEKKRYRDREHPFFSDPLMISLYAPEPQPSTSKANLMDSFLQLGQNQNNTKEVPASSSQSSLSPSQSTSSTVPTSLKQTNSQNGEDTSS